MRRLLMVLLVLVAAAQPARAGTGSDTQTALWRYGDTGGAWTGADGTYSVELPDGRIAWLFSDTFLGQVHDGARPSDSPFVHNSIVLQDHDQFSTLVTPGPGAEINPVEGAGYYWLGDGVVENNELLVFCLRFASVPVPFGFQQIGVDIARFSLPSMKLQSVERAPQAFQPAPAPVSYGSAIMQDGGYDYVYGVEDLHADKYLHVARVRAGHLLDGTWEYFGPNGWTTNALLSSRGLNGIANELSVSPVGGQYVLVSQDHSIGADIVAFTAPAPTGPWSVPRTLYTASEAARGLLTYNAKAHEELSSPGDFVISYNVNTTNAAQLYSDVSSYRPRFVDVTL
ncbi:MAG: DUF4185 domain-containing protein [Actinomycetota bacterium]